MNKNEIIEKAMLAAPVIPVVVINDVKKAIGLAKALVAGGLPAIEITLRTPNALDCIRAVAQEVEGAIAGAGTVLDISQMKAVEPAGAKFMVSPGTAPKLLDAADDSSVALLPGAATASEMMQLGERGYTYLKFFPAEAAGGANYLKSISSPLPQFKICPTGGVSLSNAAHYLALPNVLCVGGSWVAPGGLIENEYWSEITKLAKEAAQLAR
jgi:2-dehydro-3-deoxyphosphogluconate aldolase/(4S)-4-hydroxy-2-oxoglutarate aldolase